MSADQVVRVATDLVTVWGLRVVGALAVLIFGWMAAGVIRRSLRRLLERAGADRTLVPFLSGLAYYMALAFVVIAVLNLFGLPTTSLVAVLGAAGLAVGLALQGTLSNFAAGVMLLVFRPFAVGDLVEAGGARGRVEAIGLFSTTIKSADNVRITVPNAKIYGETIQNYDGYDTRRVDLVMGISYDDDIGRAMDTIRRVVEEDDRVLAEPAPQIAVAELGASSVDLAVRPWCATGDYWGLRFDLTRRLKEELEAAGCSFPFPQRDVHLFEERVEA